MILLQMLTRPGMKHNTCVKQKHGKPRSFWCPELGLLKHRKRFWWRLWKLNDRPSSGEVYECWKAIKKEFRRVSRRKLNDLIQKKNQKRNTLFKERKMRAFWNGLKLRKGDKGDSILHARDFVTHYGKDMQNSAPYTESQQRVVNIVNELYTRLSKGNCFNCSVSF
jgi:hypothetical protein